MRIILWLNRVHICNGRKREACGMSLCSVLGFYFLKFDAYLLFTDCLD